MGAHPCCVTVTVTHAHPAHPQQHSTPIKYNGLAEFGEHTPETPSVMPTEMAKGTLEEEKLWASGQPGASRSAGPVTLAVKGGLR